MSQIDGNATLRFLESSRFVGEIRQYCCGYASPSGERSSAYWPNIAFICPQCGELWARAVYSFEFTYRPIPLARWVVKARHCPECGDGHLIPPDTDLATVSPELLKREVFLLLFSKELS
jgi:predicted RNA-binding Zn-ribbon protein involved in translation (DUF1610 family)